MRNYLNALRHSEFRASALALVVSNLTLLLGVVWFGWQVFPIFAIYWAENVVVGLIYVLKIITCEPPPVKQVTHKRRLKGKKRKPVPPAVAESRWGYFFAKARWVWKFAFGYFWFCLGHGFFVVMIFRNAPWGTDPWSPLWQFMRLFSDPHLWWAIALLAASHLYSFWTNFLGKGEYRRVTEEQLTHEPLGRVITLHVAIVFGGVLAKMLGGNVWLLVVLVLGKTVLDLQCHLREHVRLENATQRKPLPVVANTD